MSKYYHVHNNVLHSVSYILESIVPVAYLSSIILYVLASVLCQHKGNCIY